MAPGLNMGYVSGSPYWDVVLADFRFRSTFSEIESSDRFVYSPPRLVDIAFVAPLVAALEVTVPQTGHETTREHHVQHLDTHTHTHTHTHTGHIHSLGDVTVVV